MKTVKPLDIVKFKGKICEVIGFATDKVVFLRPVNSKPCPHCHEIKEYAEVESSRYFQNEVGAVETLNEN
jgi:hypothetical protein